MRLLLRGLIVAAIALGSGTLARAEQITSLVAPGPLSKAHAKLEGVGNCTRCHDGGGGRPQSTDRCLTCHKPIAERIARKTGVHRAAGDCTKCHVEHGIAGAELRPIDTQKFDHAAETGFTLEGRHADAKCSACHQTRSFLDARPVCSSCHTDVHRKNLGTDCASCHSPSTPFKQTRAQFDHSRAQFALTGAHRAVACEKCHVAGVFRGLQHDMCSTCHQEPHRRKFGPVCTSCHTTDQWTTRTVDHAKTGFTLVGAHTQVACAKCHQSGSMTKPLRFDQCSACHVNVHRESAREDCHACHTETGFRGAKFDHGSRTSFPLVGKHDGLACRQCHTSVSAESVPLARKVVDFGGMKTECAACHEDKHKGEYGRVCDTCHRPMTFKTAGFTHPKSPEFYAGRHASATCAQCHVRAGPQPMRAAQLVSVQQPTRAVPPIVSAQSKTPSMACKACHSDVHLGQVGTACENCHAIDADRFAPVRFSHQRGGFPLTGKHEAVECAKCHPTETRAFPAGHGTATRLSAMATECRACHKDPHLGQIVAECSTCHTPATFSLSTFAHPGVGALFSGFHGKLACQVCHKVETGEFPAGRGTAVRFKVGSTCAACHKQM
jgi:hypothetical protein